MLFSSWQATFFLAFPGVLIVLNVSWAGVRHDGRVFQLWRRKEGYLWGVGVSIQTRAALARFLTRQRRAHTSKPDQVCGGSD